MKTTDVNRMIQDLEARFVNQMANSIQEDIDRELILELIGNWPKDTSAKLPYGWAGAWHNANQIGFKAHMEMYMRICRWINRHVKNPKQNAQWTKIGDCLYVHIRKPQDFTAFILTFGPSN